MTAPSAPARGLLYVLAATAVAGVSGYAIQLLAASLIPVTSDYLTFAAFWSTLFLIGTAVGGVQQEIARASRPQPEAAPPGTLIGPFALRAIVAVTIVSVAVSIAAAPLIFGTASVGMGIALVAGLVGYVLTSIATGLFYGLGQLGTVAVLITVDAVLRGVAVLLALVLGAPLEILGFAVALPFGLAVAAVWSIVRRRIVGHYALDVSTSRLTRNTLHTIAAAAATGVMVTGMPLLFRIALTDATAVAVASLTLVVTLTRAPFIIPLMALQSYLVVSFRGDPPRVTARLVRYLLLAGGLALVAGVAAWWIGPVVVEVVSAGRYSVDGFTSLVVVLSAVLVGSLCLSGPALLAQGRHRPYSAGWVAAAVVTVASILLLPLEPLDRALVALVVAPISGLVVHLVAVARGRSHTGA